MSFNKHDDVMTGTRTPKARQSVGEEFDHAGDAQPHGTRDMKHSGKCGKGNHNHEAGIEPGGKSSNHWP